MPDMSETIRRLSHALRPDKVLGGRPKRAVIAVYDADLAALLNDHERLQAALGKAMERIAAEETKEAEWAKRLLNEGAERCGTKALGDAATFHKALNILREEFELEEEP